MDKILCDELLEEVLRRLPPRSGAVSLVSKRWLRLYRSSKSTLLLHLFHDDWTPPSLSSFLSHFPHLSSLSITDFDLPFFSVDLLLSVASSSCPNLKSLRLQPGPLSLFPLLSLSNSCPRLTSLSITLPRPPLSFHWLLSFPSLEKLAVVFYSKPPGEEFEHVDDDAASKGKNFFDDAELKLETLHVSRIRPGDCGFDWLWRSCKNLRELRLEKCEGMGEDTSVSSLVSCLKGLQRVRLVQCGSIVDEILSRLAENCTSLNSLLIHDDVEGSRVGLLQFITHSRCNLQKIDLNLPLDLDDNHLLAVAEKFRGLSLLRLHNCLLFTAEGLRAMALAMSDKLEELALINCKVEPGLLTTLGQKFRNLRELDLSVNGMLVDEEFILMLASCKCLTGLKVRRCVGLTNASVVSMFKSCKQLESVDIMNCPGIEAECVELFVLKCLQLRQIHVEESKLSDVSRSWASKKLVELLFD